VPFGERTGLRVDGAGMGEEREKESSAIYANGANF